MTTALMRLGGGLLVEDVLLLELPDVPEDKREDVLWDVTSFPFRLANETPMESWHRWRSQLREARHG